MKAFSSFARRYTAAALLLTTAPLVALAHQPAPAAAAGSPLRVIVSTPDTDSPIVRVRYESATPGAVRLLIRDAQGQVVYADLKRQSSFAGDLNLSAFPSGDYTLELSNRGTTYTEAVRLSGGPTAVNAWLAAPKLVSQR